MSSQEGQDKSNDTYKWVALILFVVVVCLVIGFLLLMYYRLNLVYEFVYRLEPQTEEKRPYNDWVTRNGLWVRQTFGPYWDPATEEELKELKEAERQALYEERALAAIEEYQKQAALAHIKSLENGTAPPANAAQPSNTTPTTPPAAAKAKFASHRYY